MRNQHPAARECICIQLRTKAGLEPLGPRVLKLRVPDIATVVGPSTAGSATTAFAGLIIDDALWAHSTDCPCVVRRRGRWYS